MKARLLYAGSVRISGRNRHYLTVGFNNYVRVAKRISALGLAAEFFQRI
jgi:hypothetical protein